MLKDLTQYFNFELRQTQISSKIRRELAGEDVSPKSGGISQISAKLVSSLRSDPSLINGERWQRLIPFQCYLPSLSIFAENRLSSEGIYCL